jgi:hypothetical protein
LLAYTDGEEFIDGFKPSSSPLYTMNIEGNNLLNVTVKCFSGDGNDKYIFNSSLNPEIYFSSSRSGLFGKLLKPVSYFQKPKSIKR